MQYIQLPWGAWYGDHTIKLKLPSTFRIDYYDLGHKKPLSNSEIDEKLNNLKNYIHRKHLKPNTIVIVIDDLTRPVILEPLLNILLKKLSVLGYSNNQIKFLIGLGAHQPLNEKEIVKKVGNEIIKKYTIINHNIEDTIPTGLQWGKTDVKINQHYLNADFKIVISGLTPHSFAGFSGGAKMLIPGIADLNIITKTHKSVLMGFMGNLGDVTHNRFRIVIEKLVEKIGLDYFIGVVINGDRSIADINCGDFKQAHREAAAKARKLYLKSLKANAPYDLLILNAYPKDTELLQVENAFIPIKSSKEELMKENCIVVVTSACSEGLGYHGLFGPKGVLYRKPKALRFLKNRKLLFFSPNIDKNDFETVFCEEYLLFNKKESLEKYLSQMKFLPKYATVGVFPYASLQLIENNN